MTEEEKKINEAMDRCFKAYHDNISKGKEAARVAMQIQFDLEFPPFEIKNYDKTI